jgi:hypothetical protein
LRAKIRTLLFGLAFGAALTGPATAEEQLVMPFACRVQGGKVVLARNAPQAYQIYGRREEKRLTTCSPFNPRRCQNWSVHRFDLECGGVRTSWQSVVAAMTPVLTEGLGANGDAGVGETPPGARPYQPRPGRAIHFPAGFAPNPMMVASFKQIEAAPAQIVLPSKKPDLPAPSPTAEIEPDLKPAAAPSSSGDKADAASKAASAERKATELAKYEPLQIEVDSGSGEVTGSLPKSGASSGTLWRDAAMVFALTLAALLALSATLLRRRRMQTLAVAHLPRGQTALPSFSRTSHARLERAAVHQQRDIPGTRLRLWDEDWLPATMSEALDVLGVDPTASRDTMKTTVTRLRRALHPDHAIDEEDRRLRERRLKQINVAWDIVSGKRRSLWLSRKPRSS